MSCAPERSFFETAQWRGLSVRAQFAFASLCYWAELDGQVWRTEKTLEIVTETVMPFSGLDADEITRGLGELVSAELIRISPEPIDEAGSLRFTIIGPMRAAPIRGGE